MTFVSLIDGTGIHRIIECVKCVKCIQVEQIELNDIEYYKMY